MRSESERLLDVRKINKPIYSQRSNPQKSEAITATISPIPRSDDGLH